jgi:hypothetical protein
MLKRTYFLRVELPGVEDNPIAYIELPSTSKEVHLASMLCMLGTAVRQCGWHTKERVFIYGTWPTDSRTARRDI